MQSRIPGFIVLLILSFAVLVAFAGEQPDRSNLIDTHQNDSAAQAARHDPQQHLDRYPPGKIFKDCPDCPEMVVIPAGSFEMGSDNAFEDEKPVHQVTLPQAFAMSKTEITQEQWKTIMGKTTGRFFSCGSTCPETQVSWNDAQEFIQKLNTRTGEKYRLPSEAEWEYACRAGTHQEYCGSNNVTSVAWADQSFYLQGETSGGSHSVAGKQPNAWGLYDMSGNVWEWVEDAYHKSYAGAPVDGSAWNGSGNARVFRGGSWDEEPKFALAASRFSESHSFGFNVGFRVARTLP